MVWVYTEYYVFKGHMLETFLNATIYCNCKSNRLMDLSFLDCFDDDEREGGALLSAGNKSRLYYPHYHEIHRSIKLSGRLQNPQG